MTIADIIRRMAEAGAPPEAIAIAVEAIETARAADVERRKKRAEQKASRYVTRVNNVVQFPGLRQ